MKSILVSLIIILVSLTSFAQNQVAENENSSENKIQKYHDIAVYKLFPTQNMWTFIKLNTRNGKMSQVQFDVQGDNRLETFLNIKPLVTKEKEVNGRFTLYSTENIYTFILLDQIDGKTWQVQWSMEMQKRLVVPIE